MEGNWVRRGCLDPQVVADSAERSRQIQMSSCTLAVSNSRNLRSNWEHVYREEEQE